MTMMSIGYSGLPDQFPATHKLVFRYKRFCEYQYIDDNCSNKQEMEKRLAWLHYHKSDISVAEPCYIIRLKEWKK